MRFARLLQSFVLFMLAACAFAVPPGPGSRLYDGDPGIWTATFYKYLPAAEAGDPEYQNLIGFMLFFGEGIAMDRAEAHYWFHRAADAGNTKAQRSLAIMHYTGLGVPTDLEEASIYASLSGMTDLDRQVAALKDDRRRAGHGDADRAPPFGLVGEHVYAKYCAGCHGLNGIAAYIESPSFALGERLQKPDAALIKSIRNGRGTMPSWGDKLRDNELIEVLVFVRGLERRYEDGIGQVLLGSPEVYYLFGPMSEDDSAHRVGVDGDPYGRTPPAPD